jgi:transcriptional regulator with XRE-family HTH domain
MPATVVYIGERLKRQRTRRALTQAELAEYAGVTTLRKLAQALEVDPAELVED